MYASCLSALAFFKSDLITLTAFSALPLLCGYLGDDVTGLNPYDRLKKAQAYAGPLSVIIISGIPYLAKCCLQM